MKKEKGPNYFISYASTANHSFIIITKQVISPKNHPQPKNIVIASFGLYGEQDRYLTSILTCGFRTENGRLRSDHFVLNQTPKMQELNEIEIDDRYLGVKSFQVSRKTAIRILNEAKQDAKINELKKPVIKKSDRRLPTRLRTEVETKAEDITHFFDEEEKNHHLWFRNELNKNQRGGPNFNGRDFNCKKYSIYILRKAGIYDPDIEKDRYPNSVASGLKLGHFSGHCWESKLNVVTNQKKVLTFPRSYLNIFNSHKDNPIEGALAILRDYAENSLKNSIFHPKRHHCSIIREAIIHIEKNREHFKDIISILVYLKTKVNKHKDVVGSLYRRYEFLLEKSRQINPEAIPIKQEIKEVKHLQAVLPSTASRENIDVIYMDTKHVGQKPEKPVEKTESAAPAVNTVTSKNTYSLFSLRNAGIVVGAIGGVASGLPAATVLGCAAVGGILGGVTQKLAENCGITKTK
ncbi:MAG: hypothetical protein JSR33_12970 [Proteobacteria bacterium]|nr:hypothetical protein [Pseudomonadota bacterium]